MLVTKRIDQHYEVPHRTASSRPGNRVGYNHQAGLQVVERVVGMGFVFERQRAVGRELNLTQRLKHADNIEMAAAKHDVVRLLAEFGDVLEMDAIDAVGERSKAADRVFAACQVMTAIDAGADPLFAAYDHLGDAIELVVGRARPVIVDRNADVVFGNEPMEAGKRLGLGLGIGGDRAYAELLGKFKNPFVRCVG